MQHQFGLQREDVMFCASDFGWVVGHSYILYCPLFLGATSIIFEGKRTSDLARQRCLGMLTSVRDV